MFKIVTKENIKDFKYFSWSEIACHCNGKYCKGHDIPYSYQLLELLTDIRKHFGKALIITSPTRCVTWNKKQNGTTKSRHTWYKYNTQKGTTATDFYVKGVSYSKLLAYVKKIAKKYDVHYYYNVSGSVMHIDINPKKYEEPKPVVKTDLELAQEEIVNLKSQIESEKNINSELQLVNDDLRNKIQNAIEILKEN